jgi:hypothetical protein
MNVEIGTEAAQFPEKEYINGIFLAVEVSVVYLFSPPFPLLSCGGCHLPRPEFITR